MARTTYTDAQKAEALALYETHGPTVVQKQLGIPKNTVAQWAKKAGVGTVRNEKTAAATEAQQITDKHRRTLVASKSLAVTDQIADLIAERLQTEGYDIPIKDLGVLMGIFADKHKLLAKFDDDGGLNLPAVEKFLEHMTGGVDGSQAVGHESPASVGEPVHVDPSV